jgi:hypothetical protein
MVVCTEPSPDVAKALSTASQLSGKAASGPEVAVNFASAEAAAELAGRTTALLGLRDGLFKACEAYANGAIGDLAYLLVLNRYGQLMATLFLGQDAQGSAGAAELARIQSPTLALGSGGGSQNGNSSKGGAGTQQGTQTAPASTGQTATGGTAPASGIIRLADWVPQLKQLAATGPSAPASAKQGTNKPGSGSQGSGNNTDQTPKGGAVVTADFTKMVEDYLSLNNSPELLHMMAIACLEEFDPTRATPVDANGKARLNLLLQQNCPAFIAGLMLKLQNLPVLASTH